MGWLSHIITKEIDGHLIGSSSEEKEQELEDLISELTDKVEAIQTEAGEL